MSQTTTYYFENLRLAQQLFHGETPNLKALERQFGIKAVARDNWLRVEGDEQTVNRVEKTLRLIEDSVKNGIIIRAHDFAHALTVAEHDGLEALRTLQSARIYTSSRKPVVIPKTIGQRKYVEAIRESDITFGVGPAGTGKTYLAMAMAVSALKEEKCNRLILTRPAVEAGEALGFLPGDLNEKITPYLRPLYDALFDMMPHEEMLKNQERGIIEIAPLAYMRGRTLNNSFVILDEAQNATRAQMLMFLTRMGINTKVVITGDPSQVDLPASKRSGLYEAIRILRKIPNVTVMEFQKRDVVRHALVQRIIEAYEKAFRSDPDEEMKPRIRRPRRSRQLP
ncbi:MAG: PhoH family protein [Limisphaerales bacterium]|jgi:phosphate starvation-inducible PhoH-like protein|nr:PhoH family protein [Verrucomicrobiota bacterium]